MPRLMLSSQSVIKDRILCKILNLFSIYLYYESLSVMFSYQLQSHANRYKRYIVPVLSVQMDFYLRVFVRIYT